MREEKGGRGEEGTKKRTRKNENERKEEKRGK